MARVAALVAAMLLAGCAALPPPTATGDVLPPHARLLEPQVAGPDRWTESDDVTFAPLIEATVNWLTGEEQ